jgi:hypothetical protein
LVANSFEAGYFVAYFSDEVNGGVARGHWVAARRPVRVIFPGEARHDR